MSPVSNRLITLLTVPDDKSAIAPNSACVIPRANKINLNLFKVNTAVCLFILTILPFAMSSIPPELLSTNS
jgi:hypothetical protein